MRKLVLTTVLTALMGASVALAIPQTGTIVVTETPGSFYSDGGQFTATVGSESFQTFCIEINYVFSPGATYDYTLGQATHLPPNPPTAATSLTLGAAWLFSQFSSGAFVGGLALSPNDAGALQAAIWFFQNQGPNPNGAFTGAPYFDGLPGNSFTDLALLNLGGSAYLPNGNTLPVEVVQSSDANGNPAQDWLYTGHVPDGGTTIMMLGFGLTVLAFVSRRFAVAK